MARLEVLEGLPSGQSFTLTDEVILGRSPENTVCLPDHRISRRHARILRRGAHFAVEDLNSANGVLLQGERIPPQTPCELHDGDVIAICSTRIAFRDDEAGAAKQPLHRIGTDIALEGEMSLHELALEHDFGSLSLMVLADDLEQPRVTVALDASVDVTEVDEDEKQTDKGLQEALKRLQAICQVSIALGTITDREKLLQKIIDCIFDIFPAAERSFILLRDKDNNTLVPVAAQKRQDGATQHEAVAISRTIVNDVLTHRQSILSHDAMGDTRFNEQTSVLNLAIRSMMCAPLLIGEEILGLVQVDTSTGLRSFTSEDLQILTGISAQAAIAIKNRQLYEAVETETARRTSLQRYFSPGLVEMLMSSDLATALDGDAYQGIVLFADIIGFTAMSEVMSPAAVVARLNRYFTIMQKMIYDHGGNVDKFSGDALMAFWGVPQARQHHEIEAILSALRMQEQLWSFNLKLQAEGQQPIHMGIGLNAGEFVAGNIGSEDKIEFTLIGDSVNLAARIEALAGRYQVLVSKATWEPIKHLVCAVQMPPVMVKGKSRPVTIYSIRGIQDATHDGCVLALPCHILNAEGDAVGHGMLTGSKGVGTGFCLVFRTDASLTPGDFLTLRLVVDEYHQTLVITTTVESCSTITVAESLGCTKAVLTGIAGDTPLVLLTPGSCLGTAHMWENLARS